MSNCIDVQGSVRFKPGVIDVARLAGLIESVRGMKKPPDYATDGGDKLIAWWFLDRAVEIEPSGAVRWSPGQGCRSSHTWRDLRGTMQVLGAMASENVEFMLQVADLDWPTPYQYTRFKLTRKE